MQATVYNLAGEQVGHVDLDDAVFGIEPNMAVVHRAVLRQQANARQGTHETKTRSFVSGGGRKPWRQKGTGRARQGSTRSPQWRHGGVVFGPHVRSYEQDMPRKMRRLAIRSVLSSKAADGHLLIIDDFADLEPRTKAMRQALDSLNIGKESALIFTSGGEDNLRMAANNLPHVTMMSAHLLSIVDMLKHTYIVMPRTALDVVHGILSNNGGRNKLPLSGSTWNGETNYVAEAAPAATEPEAEPETEVEAPPTAAKTRSRSKAAAATEPVAEPAEEAEVVRFAPTAAQQATAASTEEETESAEPAPVAASSVAQAGTVTIANVHYTGDEYVELANNGEEPVDLSGWVLRDQNDAKQSFTFPEGTQLEPGATLQVYTKPGNTYSFNSKRPIWNDQGDALELLDANGDVVTVYAYGSFAENSESEG